MSDWSDITASLDAMDHIWDDGSLGSLVVTNRVYVRNELGQFAAHVEEAHERATQEALEAGARAMAAAAPMGKTGALKSSADWHLTGSKTGEITIGTDHWRYVAYGTRPHGIRGSVRFWWAREDRMWVPGINTIHHPGSAPNDFIEVGYRVARETLIDAMAREYRYISV